MALQDNSLIKSDDYLRGILNLEKKYFDLIFNTINSEVFKKDLLAMEKEIQDRYQDYEKVWNLKNKFDLPAERLVAHHIYRSTYLTKKITGMYTSAISSDIGIIVGDAVLSIDVKTNDLKGNKGDYNTITAEKNQISFDNSNYELIPTVSNLNAISRYRPHLPILTYVVKIGYFDDGHSFRLIKDNSKYPTIQLACIPNGRLSKLFDYNILTGFKTYKYSEVPDQNIVVKDKEQAMLIMEKNANYIKIEKESNLTYRDIQTGDIWRYTSRKKLPIMRVLTGGNTARVDTETLKKRKDGNNQSWKGIKTITYD